jgi:hypothetical protein
MGKVIYDKQKKLFSLKGITKNIFNIFFYSSFFKISLSLYLKYILISTFLILNCSEIGIEPKEEIIECEAVADVWTFLGLENETVTAIAVDPVFPKIIYAGTASDFSAGIDGKLFKSTDCGNTWDTLLIGGSFREILIDPTNRNIIYALPGSIIKSEDAGKTWQTIINGIQIDPERRVQSLAIDPQNTNILYAGTGGFYGGTMYKSVNGGMHWNEIGDDSLRDGVISIAIDPINTNNIYAGTAFRCILWKSSDAGSTWFRTGLGENETFVHDIYIDPQSSIVYAGIRGVFKTEDGGINWEKLDQGLPNVIIDIVKINKYSSRLFIITTFGDDGGIYEYSYLENHWTRIGIDNLHVSYYYSDLEANSLNPDKVYFGGKGIYVMGLQR